LIGVDASVVVNLILDIRPYSQVISQRIAGEAPALYAPYLLDAEMGQVLRRWVLRGELFVDRALVAIEDLWALPICRYPHKTLLERAFELRKEKRKEKRKGARLDLIRVYCASCPDVLAFT
jgi:predicted nucleic acid-binding protein